MSESAANELSWESLLKRETVMGAHWYALLDAAQDEAAPGEAQAAGLQAQPLYAGDLGARLAHVAPHLARFELAGPFTDWFLSRWDQSVGVLLQSPVPFDQLHRHLRKFLRVKDQQGKTYRFRYYDPRVLRAFIPACTTAEAKEFFGPIARFLVAGRRGRSVHTFTLRRGNVIAQEQPAPPPPINEEEEGQATEPAGELVVAIVDAQSGAPIEGASVQAAGPSVQETLSAEWGEARFEALPLGVYDVFAIDAELRSGRVQAAVTEESSRVRLECRPAVPQSLG